MDETRVVVRESTTADLRKSEGKSMPEFIDPTLAADIKAGP